MTEPASAVTAAGERSRSLLFWLPLFALALALTGGATAAAANQPKLLLGGTIALCVLALAFRMPVANLALLLFLTAVVPFQVLNHFSIDSDLNSPGLLFSDVFLLAGLVWAALALPSLPLDRRRYLYSLAMFLFLALVAIQIAAGVSTRNGVARLAISSPATSRTAVSTAGMAAAPPAMHSAAAHPEPPRPTRSRPENNNSMPGG